VFDYIPFPVFTHTTGITHFQFSSHKFLACVLYSALLRVRSNSAFSLLSVNLCHSVRLHIMATIASGGRNVAVIVTITVTLTLHQSVCITGKNYASKSLKFYS